MMCRSCGLLQLENETNTHKRLLPLFILIYRLCLGVRKSGMRSALDAGSRRFKSYPPDRAYKSYQGVSMSLFIRVLVDSDAKECIYLYEHGNDLPIKKLSRQDCEILRQNCEAVEKELISLTVNAPFGRPSVIQTATISRHR